MIEDGCKTPTKLDSVKFVSKPRSKWDEKNFTMANLNPKQ